MKKILLLLLVGISLSVFSQKKIKFNKDIFPLLESKDFATATPLLLDFVKSINGEAVDHANVDDGIHALKSGIAANKSLLNNKPTMV